MSNGSRVLTTSYRWRLRELMAQSGYHTATALHAALNNRGVALSQSQVCRIVGPQHEADADASEGGQRAPQSRACVAPLLDV